MQNGMAPMTKEMKECMEACMACHTMCEETMTYCLQMSGGGDQQMQVMRALMDCTGMTRMCADMMMRRSPMMTEMCAMCARACEMCAEACMAMPDDEQMRRCAEACRKAASMCRSMAGAHA
ncbi:four-helix bundle copper-binding protein [Streptomyces sp. NPDC005438]|uniref:four-helix bundle copper-binding protein n=1 Tax=Streptomyces sp. NPDC005438 TaxID=3156880 RepID=UPI0033AB4375